MTCDSETTAAPVMPTGLKGYTRRSSRVRSHALTMSRIARSTTSVESRFWQSQSSRIRCRPTLFTPSPPPEYHRRNGATETLHPMLGHPDHQSREFHPALVKRVLHHFPHGALGFLRGVGRVLKNHSVTVFAQANAD